MQEEPLQGGHRRQGRRRVAAGREGAGLPLSHGPREVARGRRQTAGAVA